MSRLAVTLLRLSKVGLLIWASLAWALSCSATPAGATTQAFSYTGGEQVFTVPAGVTSLHIVGIGGRGGADGGSDTAGGFGSVVTADLSVTPGQLLYIEVGGNGKDGQGSYSMGSQTFGGAGGFNGGAKGGGGLPGGGGGGGASDVRTSPQGTTGSLDSRLLVAAGGGGGAGGNGAPPGGAGGAGGAAGDSNSSAATGGGPGSSTAGGSAGTSEFAPGASPGTLGAGGAGTGCGPCSGSGGGGGGLYGGGGGGVSSTGAGGGGGGSNTFAGSASNVSVVGDTTGTPSVTLSYTVATGGGGSGGGTGGSAPPSNQFQLSPAIVGRSGTINLPLNTPGPGTVIGVAKTSVPVNARVLVRASKKRRRARTITYGKGTVSVAARGLVILKIAPSSAAKKALKKTKKLKVTVSVTFTPVGGTPKTQTTRAIVMGVVRRP